MSQHLRNELHNLASQVAAAPDDVADLGADITLIYRRERMIALGLAAVDSTVNDGLKEIAEDDPGCRR